MKKVKLSRIKDKKFFVFSKSGVYWRKLNQSTMAVVCRAPLSGITRTFNKNRLVIPVK